MAITVILPRMIESVAIAGFSRKKRAEMETTVLIKKEPEIGAFTENQ